MSDAFTDEDLKILKANRIYWENITQSEPNHLIGLIARLEAAEKVCEVSEKMTSHGFATWDALDAATEAWHKAAGK